MKNNIRNYCYIFLSREYKINMIIINSLIGFNDRFARRFLDAREVEGDARSLMNLHNNKVGRKVGQQSVI